LARLCWAHRRPRDSDGSFPGVGGAAWLEVPGPERPDGTGFSGKVGRWSGCRFSFRRLKRALGTSAVYRPRIHGHLITPDVHALRGPVFWKCRGCELSSLASDAVRDNPIIPDRYVNQWRWSNTRHHEQSYDFPRAGLRTERRFCGINQTNRSVEISETIPAGESS